MPRWLTGTVLFVSGFATLSYEILWFRGLHYFVGNATYAISTVLIIFLLGLGLGSLLLKRTVERGTPERDLALIQLAIAVLAVSAMACDWFLISRQVVRDNITIFAEGMFARPWWWRLFFGAVISVVTLLPATLLMGLSFPLASRLFLGDVRKLGSRVGTAYLLANIGSIAGASLAAIILLPQFGTVGGTKLIAIINLLLGLALIGWIPANQKDMARPVALAIIITTLLVVVLPSSLPLRGEWLTADEPGKVISVEEGDLATVQVLKHPLSSKQLAMSIDGFKIGWSEGFRGTQVHEKQVLLAHLPMVLDPRIRHTLNVGLGSGGTLDTLATYPEIETLDCVEINAPVLRGCQLFPESRVLDDPRVTVTIDDAVHYLMRTEKQFDLIISDGKQHPFYSGNATLLCREYYELARDRLSDDGMFVQWVPMSMLHDDLEINLRTICDVFPHVEAFFFPKWAIYVVASHRPLQGRPTMSQQQYDSLAVRRDMKLYMIDQPTGLLSHWAAGKDQLQRVLGDGPQCTWDHMRLDFSAYKANAIQWTRAKSSNLELLIAASEIEATTGQGPGDIRKTAFGRSADQIRRSFAAYYGGDLAGARRHAAEAVSISPDDREAELTRSFMFSRKTAEGLLPSR